jgi:hypothetical protein
LLRERLFDRQSWVGWRYAGHEGDEVFWARWFFDIGLRGLEDADLSARGKLAVYASILADSI